MRIKEMITQLAMRNLLFQWLHQLLEVRNKTSYSLSSYHTSDVISLVTNLFREKRKKKHKQTNKRSYFEEHEATIEQRDIAYILSVWQGNGVGIENLRLRCNSARRCDAVLQLRTQIKLFQGVGVTYDLTFRNWKQSALLIVSCLQKLTLQSSFTCTNGIRRKIRFRWKPGPEPLKYRILNADCINWDCEISRAK